MHHTSSKRATCGYCRNYLQLQPQALLDSINFNPPTILHIALDHTAGRSRSTLGVHGTVQPLGGKCNRLGADPLHHAR